MKLTQMTASATQTVLLYGAAFTGKTELAGSLAEKYKLLYFDIEKSYITLTKLPVEWQERIEIISIPDSRVYPIAIETLMKVVKGDPVSICEAHGKVSCALCKRDSLPSTRICLNETPLDTIVVFDSLTQFTNSAISHITKNQPDDYKMDFSDWGNLAVLVDKFLSQIQVAKYNVVCITHESEVEMEDGRKKLVPVCGSSKSSRNTAKYFDHVVYCEVKNKRHVAGSGTGYSTNIVTGSRSGIEIERAEKLSLLNIFTSWKGGFGNEKLLRNSESPPKESQEMGMEPVVQVPVKAKTPGEIALENLRLKGLQKHG